MKKTKILAVALSATLVFTSSSICFAANGIDGEQIQAEATAELVEDITGTEDINQNIEETADGFEVEGEDVDITLPEDGDGNIVMDSEEESIGMGLPEEVQDEEGILTDEGTVIYGATEDVSVAVQAGEEEQEDGMSLEFTRALVTIDNADVPKEYSFNFDLPEGYKLIKCEEDGIIYVADENNESITNVEPAWAKDANGNDVETYYEIKGDELVQVVNFDEDTAFPVIADPTVWHCVSVSKKSNGVFKSNFKMYILDEYGKKDIVSHKQKGSMMYTAYRSTTKTVRVSASLHGETFTGSISAAFSYSITSGRSLGIEIPNDGKRYYIKYVETWRVRVYETTSKYRVTKITNNGKNKNTKNKTCVSHTYDQLEKTNSTLEYEKV